MTTHNVHIYREMRLTFDGIEADTPEAAAAIARDKPTGDADEIDDCEGITLSALVDVVGDKEYEQSQFIDFEPERRRNAAPGLLAAVVALMPYAESEGESLYECWKRDGDLQIKDASDRCAAVIANAHAAIAETQFECPAVIQPTAPSIHLEISEDAFDDHYPLKVNHLNPHASWGDIDDGGCLFETYGDEFAFVRAQPPSTVWTFVDSDESDQYLLSGCHFVNRIGYLISTVPVPEGVSIQVPIPSYSGKSHQTDE
jgi:hypothetical protein